MPRLVPLAAGAAAAGLVVLAGLAEQPRGAILESGTGRVAAWTRAEATRERQRLVALEELPDELPVDGTCAHVLFDGSCCVHARTRTHT